MDVVRIPPNVKHWHGAAPTTSMAHIGRIVIVEAPDPSWAPGRLNVVVNWFEEIRSK